MKLARALEIIEEKPRYRVSFEVHEGSILRSDFFPERDEMGLDSEGYAWEMAREFAQHTGIDYVNIYVMDARTFVPVPGYEMKMIRPYRPGR